MSYAEWKARRADEPAVFEAFFRKAPFNGSYTIFAGLDEVLRFLKEFKFREEHLAYIKKILPSVEDEFINWLSTLDCSKVRVSGIPDGNIVFANQPLLTLEGPFALLQLLETPILNLINFASLMTTNATRMTLVAGEKVKCVEFGLRRAQGPNGSLTASKYSYMGGFSATSNVQAGYLYDVPVAGTCAHSFIMSFEKEEDIAHSRMLLPKDAKSGEQPQDLLALALKYQAELNWTTTVLKELYAFVSFGTVYPSQFSALVDSYSTKDSGIKNFLLVSLALSELGYPAPLSIRLDSGDLVELSILAKTLFAEVATKYDKPSYRDIKVVASNDINEATIHKLNEGKHQIDVFGIGTNLVTCQAQPALGMVYKVCQFKGTSRIKISEEPSKTTIPGNKKVMRAFSETGMPLFDVLCLSDESIEEAGAPVTVYDLSQHSEEKKSFAEMQELSTELFADGKIRTEFEDRKRPLKAKQGFVQENLASFGGASRLIKECSPDGEQMLYKVYLSQKLASLRQDLIDAVQTKASQTEEAKQ